MAKKGILIVAYGLGSFSAEQAFLAFCKEAENSFKPIPVRYAFTSELSRKVLAKKGKKSDSVKKAIQKMIFEKYTHIYVQSLHLVPGIEYQGLIDDVAHIMQNNAVSIKVAPPLFHNEAFFNKAVQSLAENSSYLANEDEALLYMGHGTKNSKEFQADAVYTDLHKHLHALDSRLFLACMEGTNTLENILPLLKEKNFRKVMLFPFFTLIGKHASEDMAGTDDSSWKSQLEQAGFECQAQCVALLQSNDFVNFWLESLNGLFAEDAE